MQEYKYYIAGEFKKSSKKIEVINPTTEDVCAHIFETSTQDLNQALTKAKQAQKQWRNTSFRQRASLLREMADLIVNNLSDLANIETLEIGKPLKESLFVDVPLAADCFRYYASFLESLEESVMKNVSGIDSISYDPFGVCAFYLPYNVPLMIFGFTCAAALAAGNALIIKPSEYGSLSLLKLASLLNNLDIPQGLINIVTGKGESCGSLLAGSDVDFISFTGSRDTLKKIITQSFANPKKVVCELGGCNLTVVFSDANKQDAMQNVIASSFMKQGQMCIGTSLVLVEESIYDDFISELIEKIKLIKIGDPFDSTVGMGPLVTEEHLHGVDKSVKRLLGKGSKLLYGGQPLKQKGYFYPPTVVEIKDIIYEEFFAPIIMVKSFKKKDIENIIENNPTGLVLQLWTEDLEQARFLADKASCGTVWINTFAQISPQTPFGGSGLSGWGRNLGKIGFFEYIQTKHIGIGLGKSQVWGWFGF
jgi:acyl-CoA reductase-like NAD-dependent aldehyde dehydrogenase